MDKLIPIFMFLGIIVIGFISKFLELIRISTRIEFTRDYRDKFVKFVNEIVSQQNFNQALYFELTTKVKEMQGELGDDGIYAYMKDNLQGVVIKDYQLLINFLPETKEILDNLDDLTLIKRYDKSVRDCDDMFIRHLGTLESEINLIRKSAFNPFSLFAEGTRTIILSPFLLLSWFGFISIEKTYKARKNPAFAIFHFIITILSFIGTIITIVVGWNDFWEIVYNFLK